MRISVRSDIRQVRASLGSLGRQEPRALMRALNRTAQQAQTVARREVARDLGIAQREVGRSMRLFRATDRVLSAVIEVAGRRLPLLAFRARQTRTGVSYRLGSRGRGHVRSAFIATMRSGHRGVFRRRGTARLPIDELHGPSLPRVFTRAAIRRALDASVRSNFMRNLRHEFRFLATRRAA